ncbi:gamma-glutamylcyclotransferase family protein [Rhodospirillum centenum]|uniref:Putative gamma-glutamylcyclotransferase n=1 Tax=Rhodospirillum centenum (strain ATCC 51521 / SW) TaxID=414684 RepID=B6IS68_RHOCS|nr:gamma-glutamylcyclotransferase family protein [Rhodospirillum centenum]ACI98304.1 AIG2-like family protein, putative [Rhodospirillum centenum SW]
MLLFAFGTLMDADVRALVLGRASPDAEARPAILPDHRRLRVAGEVYPAVVPDPGGAVAGLLLPLRSPHERERVQYFEGLHQILRGHTVRCRRDGPVTALVCASADTVQVGTEPWSFAAWRARHKAVYLSATAAYMAGFGRVGVREALAGWAGAFAAVPPGGSASAGG